MWVSGEVGEWGGGWVGGWMGRKASRHARMLSDKFVQDVKHRQSHNLYRPG